MSLRTLQPVIIAIAGLMLISGVANAYMEATHREITDRAIIIIQGTDNSGKYADLYGSERDQIIAGSDREDAGGLVPRTGRFFHHFYDGSGGLYSTGFGLLFPITYRSALDWGLGDPIKFGSLDKNEKWKNPRSPGQNQGLIRDIAFDDAKNDRGWRQAIQARSLLATVPAIVAGTGRLAVK